MTTKPAARRGLGARAIGRIRKRNGSRAHDQELVARVAALEAAVQENRALNQRLADVVDVVTEVLVPAADRDDERLRKALADLGKTLDQG
jgi:uncharacterized protein DUF6752